MIDDDKWTSRSSDGRVTELYWEMAEHEDEAGDCNGREGDRIR
jgi:hypothetical protein